MEKQKLLSKATPKTNQELVKKTKKIVEKYSPDLSKMHFVILRIGTSELRVYKRSKKELDLALNKYIEKGYELL